MKSLAMLTMAACLAGCQARQSPLADIDAILHRPDARHGTFGPTGRRLFTEKLAPGLGLRGQFCYIHHADIRDPVRVELRESGEPIVPEIQHTDWYPSHVGVRYATGSLSVSERKFITDDDTFVDQLVLRNDGDGARVFELRITSGFADRADGGALMGWGDFYGVRACGILVDEEATPVVGDAALVREVRLEPGRPLKLVVAMGFGEQPEIARQRARRWRTDADALADHRETYQLWFDENCPQFECDDPYITKMYWYRWFIARHCLSRARTGNLPYPYFFEGTHEGHFPRLIAFSSPHIITETRWLRDPRYAFGQVRNHAVNADDEHHYFISARVNGKGGEYNNWITQTAWEAFCVHPDMAFLREILPAMAADVRGTLAHFDPDGDLLPAPRNHWTTGMEFQPSFWYFADYDDTKPEAKLERGDFVAYVYGNARAVADACRRLGNDRDAEAFDRMAETIRDHCLAKMWDDEDHFCYATRQDDDSKARTREIVGFYPLMNGMLPDEPRYTRILAYLVDPDEFWTTWPPATASKVCPAYTPRIGVWPAAGGKRHDCMWNGPTWPHATSVMLDVAARAIEDYEQPYVTVEHFRHLFDRHTHLQFEQDDLGKPITHEYYDGETAFPEGVPDYFHSTYCDLVIRYLAGLRPDDTDTLTVRPIPCGFTRFSLRNVRYRGHDIDIVYNSPASASKGPRGLTVRIDGRRAAHRGDLGPISIALPTRR